MYNKNNLPTIARTVGPYTNRTNMVNQYSHVTMLIGGLHPMRPNQNCYLTIAYDGTHAVHK